MRIPSFLLLPSLVVMFASLANGQGVATGDLHVTVKDPQGNLVTNATVTVRDEAKGTERAASGNGAGEYGILALPPASYALTITAQGFAQVTVTDLVITVGGSEEIPVTLKVGETRETVEVNSSAELIEVARTSTDHVIDQRSIDNLPTNTRDYLGLMLTDSQVVRDNAPNIGAAPTSGFNVSGQRGRSNMVNVDGADATDNSVNGVRSTVPQDAVQEYRIITNGYSPEYGRAAGGVVNIVTRSGKNDFHGDVFGYLRNRSFQAVNPFSNVSNPAYTRVQAGTGFGGAIKKDKTFYYFSYEVTRRHETGFASIGQNNFGLNLFDTSQVGLPFGNALLTPGQIQFLTDPATIQAEQTIPGYAQAVGRYTGLAAASSGMAVNGKWPASMGGLPGFITSCSSPPCPVPTSFQTLSSQAGNFPVFEGTSIYSMRLDHQLNARHELTLRGNVSPSTVTGIEVNGENQTFGQNAFSRTSQQTYRDAAGTVQDAWTISNNKFNAFRFQYARRGLSYFYSSAPGGSDVAVNIPGFGYFGREPYSYIQRVEQRYQFSDDFSLALGKHAIKTGVDFNYLPLTAVFTVNYGGVYNFGSLTAAQFGFPSTFPDLSPVQAYGAGVPSTLVQGIGNPRDSFTNKPLGMYLQDAWRIRPNLTLNYGVRYDIEFPPQFAAPTGLARSAYNSLGLQKGIQTDANNVQPRVGIAWNPDSKSVVRASYGIFYDHPLLGLYFLGDASDGSKSGQLLFPGGSPCSPGGSFNPIDLNATNIFQGILLSCPGFSGIPGYQPNQQRFDPSNASLFINQNYLNPASFFPLAFQPFGYPQAKNFVYAYSQQTNLTFERDLGHDLAVSLAYNFNGGRHLNRPINANTPRGDLLIKNWQAALADGATTSNPLFVSGCNVGSGGPYVPAALLNFFRPSGLNPAIALALLSNASTAPCVQVVAPLVLQADGLSTSCDPATLSGCVPFTDMDANFSNGSSVYHGMTASLRKGIRGHYEFLGSYTWSHAIDDSTDLQAPLAPQDSFFPSVERSTSLFDQRHRFVFSGVYQSGRMGGDSFARHLLSNWTVAPIIEVASGRPFNIITGNPDNFQFSPSTGRPNVVPSSAPATPCGGPVASRFSPTGFFEEPCYAIFAAGGTPTLAALDGNLGRNAGIKPWTVFNDVRVARKIYLGERANLDASVDIFNIANKYNVADVNQLFTNAGQPTAAYNPRQLQFGLKVNW